MTPARYFIAAALLLVLGASAMPVATAAYAYASRVAGTMSTVIGVWAGLVLTVATAGPVVLCAAGLIALWHRPRR